MAYLKEFDTPFAQEWLQKPTKTIVDEIDDRVHVLKLALIVYSSGARVNRLKERAEKLESLLLILAFRKLIYVERKIYEPLMEEASTVINEVKKT